MIYNSTRDRSVRSTSSEAILRGLAPDGGLYVPEYIPEAGLTAEKLLSMDQYGLTAHILSKLLPDLPSESLYCAVKGGYVNKFETERLTPLVHLSDHSVLELYHGPTCAFKDMALCLLPRLIALACGVNGINDDVLILTATSGDTGKAALAGFADAPQTGIMVFFPNDGVSEVQKLQMTTQEGGNVYVCAVDGNFDDAQRGVKKALSELKFDGVRLSSANSINIGRLAPQVAYYFMAYADMVRDGKVSYGGKVDFVVPTGNFGNILAGYIAKRMGLPVGKLVCASNSNRVLTDFISTGVYDRRREFMLTPSPSMDILVSSNLERLLYFASDGDDKLVSSLMRSLDENGFYKAPESMMENIRRDFLCGSTNDSECLSAIYDLWNAEGYLMDPHTAIGYHVFKALKNSGEIVDPAVVLSTASPYKFAESMLASFGEGGKVSGFEAIERLYELTGVSVPKPLSALKDKNILHRDIIKRDGVVDYVRQKVGGSK